MLETAERLLGIGTHVPAEIVRLVRSVGPESEHCPTITDPTAARVERIATRREWPDSPLADLPDRYPLFALFGDVDLVAWPDLGCAIDASGQVAAHLCEPGLWALVDHGATGDIVILHRPSGGYVARVSLGPHPGEGFGFRGVDEFLTELARARTRIAHTVLQEGCPQDRG